MVDPKKRRYLYISLSVFSAIGLSLLLYFMLLRLQGVGAVLRTISDILAPFVYGGVVAYLLRPLCNAYESFLAELFPKKLKQLSNSVAVILSLVTGLLIVYTLIIMVAPQLYQSVLSLWYSLPDKINQFVAWATGIFGEDEEMLHLFNTASQMLMEELETWAKNTLVPYISNIVSGVGSRSLPVIPLNKPFATSEKHFPLILKNIS